MKGASPPMMLARKVASSGVIPTNGSAWISTEGVRSATTATATVAVPSSPLTSVTVQVAT